jgi:hypothetical protein
MPGAASPPTSITISTTMLIGAVVVLLIIILVVGGIVYAMSSKTAVASSTVSAGTNTFVTALAGTGGVILMVMVACGLAYAIFVAKVAWQIAITACLWFAVVVGIVLTSIDFAVSDNPTKYGVIVAQGVIFSACTILLGFLATYYIGTDFHDMNRYMALVMNASLLMAVVSLSATTMLKLSDA